MSTSVWFLGLALAVSLLGTAVIAWRHRSPQRFDTSIHDFSRRMSTLAPERRPPAGTERVYPDGVGPVAADQRDAPADPEVADGA